MLYYTIADLKNISQLQMGLICGIAASVLFILACCMFAKFLKHYDESLGIDNPLG